MVRNIFFFIIFLLNASDMDACKELNMLWIWYEKIQTK
jgi:hypothetical protein